MYDKHKLHATLELTLFRSDFLSRFPCEADVGEV